MSQAFRQMQKQLSASALVVVLSGRQKQYTEKIYSINNDTQYISHAKSHFVSEVDATIGVAGLV